MIKLDKYFQQAFIVHLSFHCCEKIVFSLKTFMLQVQKNSGWMLYDFLHVVSFHNVVLRIIGTNAYNITRALLVI